MSGFLEQLVLRNVESAPSAFQPRLLSRFEEARPLGNSADGEVERLSPLAATSPKPTAGHRPAPAPAASPGVSISQEHHHHHYQERTIVERLLLQSPSTPHRTSAKSSRMSPTAAPSPGMDSQMPRPPMTTARGQQSLPNSEAEPRFAHALAPQPESASARENAQQIAPLIARVLPAAVSAVRSRQAMADVPHNASFPPPQTAEQPRFEVEPSRERPAAPPPRIPVDNAGSKTREQHSVTVTIGRIDVIAPSPKAPPAQKSPRPAPRVMTLDDYARRKNGGAR